MPMLAIKRAPCMDSDRVNFGVHVERFLTSLRYESPLPNGIELLNPYTSDEVRRVVGEFTRKYYQSSGKRLAIWGINPGRFGAGVTGLSFTDPWAVREQLGISTTLDGRRELSAEFISMVIDAYGGPDVFYRDVYMCAISPLGFVKNGVNINFYDDTELRKTIVPFVHQTLSEQHSVGLMKNRCIVLGTGKLRGFVEAEVRDTIGYEHIVYLEHPRFIMQYRRSNVMLYVRKYVDTIRSLRSS